jgi:RHS repeat-associated protein
MRKNLAPLLLLALSVFVLRPCEGQVTGSYAFAPMDSYGFDAVNRGNLNVHFSIPVFSKPGRGAASFRYALNYDGLLWAPITTGSTTAWTPAENWGWTDATNALYGYITQNFSLGSCSGYIDDGKVHIDGTTTQTSGVVYHDAHGVAHGLPYTSSTNTCTGDNTSSGANPFVLTDNSGLTVYQSGNSYIVENSGGAQTSVPVYTTWNGNTGKPTPQPATYTDNNGNQIAVSSSGVFTDTMGMTVLTQTGTGTPTSPEVFTYTDSNGASQTVTVNYRTYNVATAFGAPGISEYSQTGAYLVSSIVYSADSSSYAFTYEPTPGQPGSVTGRLASVTLRTGGVISYAYTGGYGGLETDGTGSGLTRTTTDGAYSYARSNITTTTSQTQITDAYNNVQSSTFLLGNGMAYESDRKVYQGAATGTPLTEILTCYNSAAEPPCTNSTVANGIGNVSTWWYANGSQVDVYFATYTAQGSGLKASETVESENATYTYGTYTGPYGLTFQLPTEATVPAYGSLVAARKITYGYDETTPTATSGLPNHVAESGSRGNLTSIHNWIDGTHHLDETIAYDDAGQVLSQTDWNGNLTKATYDTATDTLLTKVTYPGTGLSVSPVFNANTGLLTSLQDLNGNPSSYTYDGFGRPTLVNSPDGGVTSFTYPNVNTTTVSVRQHGTTANNVSSLTVDTYGRTSTMMQTDTGGGNETVTYTYDADGRLYSATNPQRSTASSTDGTTYYTYDGASRPLLVQEPGGAQVSYVYNGEFTKITDEAGKQKQVAYNQAGQLMIVQEPDSTGAFNLVTTYGYAGSNVTDIQQTGGASSSSQYRVRTFSRDGAGRLAVETTPEQGTITYGYTNSSGALCAGSPSLPCTRTDAIGTKTTYTYDTLNRLTGTTYSDTTHAVSVAYDQSSANGLTIANGKGQRTSTADASGTSAWSYDTMGRVAADKKTINGVTKTAGYTYNLDGTMASMTDYLGHAVNYGYDSTSSLTNITDVATSTAFVSGAVYTPPGMLGGATLGNGVALANTFNNRLQPVTLGATKSGTPVFGLSYGYGSASQDNGNIASIANTIAGQSNRSVVYTYDQLNRLSGALAGTLWGYTYGIDNWGNLGQMTPTPGVTNLETSLNVSANVYNQLPGNVYDLDGRVTTDNQGTHYTYDAEGRILTAGGYSYTYNGDGVRVEKSGASSRLYWPDESGKAMNETDLTGATAVRNVYSGITQLARQDSSGNWTYMLHDHLGTTRMVLSSTGAVTSDVDYYPYGGVAYNSGSSTNLYGFTGYETDTESASNYAVFRNESPSQGRFLRPDPYDGSYDLTDPQSLNRYSYLGNRPLIFTDPSGLSCVTGAVDNGDGTMSLEITDDGDGQGCEAAGVAPGGTGWEGDTPGTWVDLDPGGYNVTTDPNGTITIDMSLGDYLTAMESLGFHLSVPDMFMGNHKGLQMRNSADKCNVHVTDISGGLNGEPVTASSHYDAVLPFTGNGLKDVGTITAHTLLDYFPDEMQKNVWSGMPTGAGLLCGGK